MSRIVITGAPGAGKTTLLLALQARGYTIVGDTARTIIQDRRRRGLSPRPDPYAFAQEALRMDIDNFVHTLQVQAASSLNEASSMRCADWIALHA
jgi:predicted ATPase